MLFNRVIALISLISLLIIMVLVGRELASDQHKAAVPLDYKLSKYSEEEWLKIARDAAHDMGMVDKPEHEEWALMTRGSYMTLLGGGGSPQDREAPLFIYKALGSVPVLMMYTLDGPARDMGGIELMFDGKTGFVMSSAAYPKDNVARGETGPDLSFIPADTGYNPHSAFPLPTAAS